MNEIWNILCSLGQDDGKSLGSFCTNDSVYLLQELDGYPRVFSFCEWFNRLHPSKKEQEMAPFWKLTSLKITSSFSGTLSS